MLLGNLISLFLLPEVSSYAGNSFFGRSSFLGRAARQSSTRLAAGDGGITIIWTFLDVDPVAPSDESAPSAVTDLPSVTVPEDQSVTQESALIEDTSEPITVISPTADFLSGGTEDQSVTQESALIEDTSEPITVISPTADFLSGGTEELGETPFAVTDVTSPQEGADLSSFGDYLSTDDIDRFQDDIVPLTESISTHLSTEQKATLARLATAFAPPGQKISLQDIEHVEVIGMDGQHINIAAVVCENDSCVSVAVPVGFPQECGLSNFAECTWNNIAQLDSQATELIQQIEYQTARDADYAKNRQTLVSQEYTAMPVWWVAPQDLFEPCENMRVLLNQEDFREEVRSLAAMVLAHLPDGHEQVVEQALVTAVCPAGMCLRANVKPIAVSDQEFGGTVVELELPFGFQSTNFDQLRDTILSAISQAAPYTQPQSYSN